MASAGVICKLRLQTGVFYKSLPVVFGDLKLQNKLAGIAYTLSFDRIPIIEHGSFACMFCG